MVGVPVGRSKNCFCIARNVSCSCCIACNVFLLWFSYKKEIVYIRHDVDCSGTVAVDIGLCFQPTHVELLQCLCQVVLPGLWQRAEVINRLVELPNAPICCVVEFCWWPRVEVSCCCGSVKKCCCCVSCCCNLGSCQCHCEEDPENAEHGC